MSARRMAGAALAAVLTIPAAWGTTVDELIEQNLEARGGAEAWKAIQSMRWEGEFTAFSETFPFTVVKKRPNLFRMDYKFNGTDATTGFDGESAWWQMPLMVSWAIPQPPAERTVTIADAEFDSALFDHAAKGHRIEYLGEGDLDGIDGHKLKVVRADGAEETWYLDKETFLEIGREAPGSDFGQPMPMRVYYSDWREVDGVQLPHLIEKEWGTRHRQMAITRVEINPPVEAAAFRLPPPAGSEPLHPMIGEWNVKVEFRSSPQAPFQETTTQSRIEGLMEGTLLQEIVSYVDETGEAQEQHRTFSFDRFRDTFRVTSFEGFTHYQKVMEGTFADGALTASTKSTELGWDGYGRKMFDQIAVRDLNDDGFVIEEAVSFDGGENFVPMVRYTYTRR